MIGFFPVQTEGTLQVGRFEEFLSSLEEPEFLKEFRKKADTLLQSAKFPDSHLESWRKLNLSNFRLSEYHNPCPPSSLGFATGKFAEVKKFSELDRQDWDCLQPLLETFLSSYESEWITLLAASRFTHAYYIKLLNEVSDDFLPEISVDCEGGDFILPLLVIDVPDRLKGRFSERWKSPSKEGFVFMNGITLLNIRAEADFQYSALENLGDSTFRFRTVRAFQEHDSKFHASLAIWGGYKGKAFFDSEVVGKGAWTRYAGLSPLCKREFQDTEIRILHKESHAQSSILFRVVARDKAHNVFTGNLHIPSNCKDVSAVQINNNLLLDSTARAESIPKLEVFADSVKCEHGATVGEIDDEQLFYLASRGISKDEARRMIVEGFLAEVIREFPSESIREELTGMIETRMLGEA